VTNFFDRDPVMSRKGTLEQFNGDSSEIIVAEALKFIAGHAQQKTPFFAVVWYGSPHSPWQASEEDRKPFGHLDKDSQNHYGELVAMDRSIGTLRKGLRDMNIAENTIVWYCSDNGGLPKISPETVGGLRGFKGSVFEGGLRVPCVIEWPAVISEPRVTAFPAATLDIFPTLAEIVGLPESVLLTPHDGTSIRAVFDKDLASRGKPIPFRHTGRAAWIDNDYKLLTSDVGKDEFQLYDLSRDPKETTDLFAQKPDIANRLVKDFKAWNESVERSVAGKNFPEGRILPGEPESRDWTTSPEYQSYIREWKPKFR
jgi:arylsulfatase A-like enzyme